MSYDVLMLPTVSIEFRPEGIFAIDAWGAFDVPKEIYARSLRLDRRYPSNYEGGYLDAWCRRQREQTK